MEISFAVEWALNSGVVVSFSSHTRIRGTGLTNSFSTELFFFFSFLFLLHLKVEIRQRAPISLLYAKIQSTLAQRAETTVNERFL